MTVFYLSRHSCEFPDPKLADPDGLLAVGGDLSTKRLAAAYAKGIFPWYGPGSPILWWAPDPRPVLEPAGLHVSASLKKAVRRSSFTVSFDLDFAEVIQRCAKAKRPQGPGVWLTPEMIRAYRALHETGLAHSVEVWEGGALVGGLYGVSLGRAFFGESMFHDRPNASKIAFWALAKRLFAWGFAFIDCQQATPHMLHFGAQEISGERFQTRLRAALAHPGRTGLWRIDEVGAPIPVGFLLEP